MKKLLGILLIGLFLILPLAGDWYWNKYTGKLDYYEKSTASPWFTTLYLYDLDLSNKLAISWPENDVVDRTLRFYINSGARIINLSGDFTLSGNNQVGLWTVTSTLLQSASQYHNFGGVAGAGGYGFRDNAGAMEFKNSGGAWSAILSATPAQEAWIAPTLLNSWVNYGGDQDTAGYMKDTNGFVHLKGCIKSGTVPANAFALPAGYRPGKNIAFAVSANSAYGEAYIHYDDGDVYITIGSNVSFRLDGITFKAEN